MNPGARYGTWSAGVRCVLRIVPLSEAPFTRSSRRMASRVLRKGSCDVLVFPLHQIGLALRHRSLDKTAYCAKVDVALLEQVAQPWQEVSA